MRCLFKVGVLLMLCFSFYASAQGAEKTLKGLLAKIQDKNISEIQKTKDGRLYVTVIVPDGKSRTQAVYITDKGGKMFGKTYYKLYSYSAVIDKPDINRELLISNSNNYIGLWGLTKDNTILYQSSFSLDMGMKEFKNLVLIVAYYADNMEKKLIKTDNY